MMVWRKLTFLSVALLVGFTGCTQWSEKPRDLSGGSPVGGAFSAALSLATSDPGVTSIGFDFDPAGATLASISAAADRSDLVVKTAALPSGRIRVLVFSRSGLAIPSTPGLLTLNFQGTSPVPIVALRSGTSFPGADGGKADGSVVPVTLSSE